MICSFNFYLNYFFGKILKKNLENQERNLDNRFFFSTKDNEMS